MDAVEFLNEAKRYCRWCKNTTQDGKKRLCEVCYFEKLNDLFNLYPMAYHKFVETIEQWAKEHPVKTRQSELLKLFPETEMIDDYICICPSRFVEGYREPAQNCNMDCEKCERDFWLKEIE